MSGNPVEIISLYFIEWLLENLFDKLVNAGIKIVPEITWEILYNEYAIEYVATAFKSNIFWIIKTSVLSYNHTNMSPIPIGSDDWKIFFRTVPFIGTLPKLIPNLFNDNISKYK